MTTQISFRKKKTNYTIGVKELVCIIPTHFHSSQHLLWIKITFDGLFVRINKQSLREVAVILLPSSIQVYDLDKDSLAANGLSLTEVKTNK